MTQDINALNASIGNLVTAITALNTGVTEILQINAQSPAPIDYTPQVNQINAALQQIQNDNNLIDAVPAVAALQKQPTTPVDVPPVVPAPELSANAATPVPAVTPAVIDPQQEATAPTPAS